MAPTNALDLVDALAAQIATAVSADEIAAVGIRLNDVIADARRRYLAVKNVQMDAPAVAAPVAPEWTPVSGARVNDGYYTVKFDDGSHVTLRFKTQDAHASWMPGKQVVAWLNGPDNWNNYQSFGTCDAYGVSVFRKWDGQVDRQVDAVDVLYAGPDAQLAGLKGYGMASGKCGLCHRMLTNPESIEAGIGPVCADNHGFA